MKTNRSVLVYVFLLSIAAQASASDWPMWRYDAARGNSASNPLPKKLHLQWSRQLTPAKPAWPKTQPRLQFDTAPQPVVMGKRIFVPSTVNDNITAYHVETGIPLWRFYAGGPIRFAPIACKNRVYFGSDDGHLYCIGAQDGKLHWKVNGGPAERWIIGNHRLVSTWPVRGGPVLHQGKIYFTASIWPFMGIFVHAVDPDTGEILWTNSGDGTNFTTQPHGADSFATVAPQGHLAATGNFLVVPGGRSTPAVFDTRTGKLVHFKFDGRNGGHHVVAGKNVYFAGGSGYLAEDAKRISSGLPDILNDHMLLFRNGSSIKAESADGEIKEVTKKDRRGRKVKSKSIVRKKLFSVGLSGSAGDVLIQAETQIITGGAGKLAAFDLGAKPTGEIKPYWTAKIDAQVHHMIAAADRLFVITKDAKLYCFGAGDKKATHHDLNVEPLRRGAAFWNDKVQEIIKFGSAGNTLDSRFRGNDGGKGLAEGFAVAVGIGSGDLIREMLHHSKFHLIVVDPDQEKVNSFRREMQQAKLYGKRISVHAADLARFALPPYMANLIVCEDPAKFGLFKDKKLVQNLSRVLRPYGGVFWIDATKKQHEQLVELVGGLRQSGFAIRYADGSLQLVRNGALPGSDNWTHQYHGPGQSGVSRDRLVKAPLGVLWFGGASHEGILPRHGHGPSPQVAGGRLFIEGPDMLRAVDVYTGRVLWEKTLKNFGKYYNTTRHFPGAGEIGGNYVSLPDNVYAVYGNAILELDAATGKLTREFKLKVEAGKELPNWGYIGVLDDLLIATSSPVPVKTSSPSLLSKLASLLKSSKNVVPRNAKWQYLAGADPKGDWTALNYAAKGWKTARAGFGYGDGDDKTTLSMRKKYGRVYIRHVFDSGKVAGVKELGLAVNYDDAFIAYLNGKEIIRAGVRRGRGAKAAGIDSHEASGHQLFPIKQWKKLIRPGKNVIAIEGHNAGLTSSDFTLDPFLVAVVKNAKKEAKPPSGDIVFPTGRYATGSRRLVVFNRKTGELLWSREAKFNFRHNNIAAGAGKIFCVDAISDARKKALARRGVKFGAGEHFDVSVPTLYALDARTGKVIWSNKDFVFGTFLNYSEEHDILVQAGSKYRDRARDESGRGMTAYRGADGKVLWKDDKLSYGGPVLLWRNRILTNGGGGFAIDIHTGKKTDWKYARKYGCNTALGSEYLLTFRSGCAGFYDLENDSGTGNLGGFRSSCTNNLIAANGVLNAPDYTRTCSCAYQNQTSLALVHMPNAEFWTFGGRKVDGRLGFNFGAPGDRRSATGTLWQAKGKITMAPAKPQMFRMHSAFVTGDDPKWVAACGVTGVKRITIDVEKGKQYRVKLVFLDPDRIAAGKRVFDVKLQGKTVLAKIDVVRSAGGSRRAITRAFTVAAPDGRIEVQLEPTRNLPAVISGVEIVRQ